MKIINFKTHENPLDCLAKDGRKEVSSFDVEFSVGGMQLVWNGWSVRMVKGRQFLQAPDIAKWTSFKRGPAISIKGQDPQLVLQMIREMLFHEHGIQSHPPKKKEPKPAENPVPDEKPKEPASKKKVNK